MSDLAPVGPALAWANRRLIAERLRWPDGALEHCERIDGTHPGWSTGWQEASAITGFEKPAGYYATARYTARGDYGRSFRPEVYGATPDELVAAIETAPPPEDDWHLRPLTTD